MKEKKINWKDITDIELVYLAPKEMLNRNWGEKKSKAIEELKEKHKFISFEDLHKFNKIGGDYPKIWSMITEILVELDDN